MDFRIPQAALDNVPKLKAQDWRDYLKACSSGGTPTDVSKLATTVQLQVVADSLQTSIAAVPEETIAALPPSSGGTAPPAEYALTLDGTVDLNAQTVTLNGQGIPVEPD